MRVPGLLCGKFFPVRSGVDAVPVKSRYTRNLATISTMTSGRRHRAFSTSVWDGIEDLSGKELVLRLVTAEEQKEELKKLCRYIQTFP